MVMSGVYYEESNMRHTFAIILSGCGFFDGSDVHEVSTVLEILSRKNIRAMIYAPDREYEVVNHITGVPMDEKRNAMVECARITRGKVLPLDSLFHFNHDALIIPGGLGSTKVLSDFSSKQTKFTIDPEVARVINDFHSNQKPIGMSSISPVLAGKVIRGCTVSVGKIFSPTYCYAEKWPYSGTAEILKRMEVKVCSLDDDEFYIDRENLLVSAPASMYNGPLHGVHDNIVELVNAVYNLLVHDQVDDDFNEEDAIVDNEELMAEFRRENRI